MPEKNIYAGPDAAEHMLDELQKYVDKILKDYIEKPKKLKLTAEEKVCLKAATECNICGGKYKANEKKVGFYYFI